MSRTPNPPNPTGPIGPGGRLPPRPVPPAASPAQPGSPTRQPTAPAGGSAAGGGPASGAAGSVPPNTVRIPPRPAKLATPPARVVPAAQPTPAPAPASRPAVSLNRVPAVPFAAPASNTVATPASSPAAAQVASTVPVFLAPGEEIVARGSRDYRIRRYLMVILLVGMGGWFAYDGFKGWPEENRKIKEISEKRIEANRRGDKERIKELDQDPLAGKPEHTGKDLFLQRLLAYLLPGIGIATLSWALYNSRGEYRLNATVISVPGHPGVELTSIVTIDRSQWDRKGIAYIEYRGAAGLTAAFDLDDFIYQRDETDRIFAIVESQVGGLEKPEDELV